MFDQSQDSTIIDEKIVCALCGEELNSEPFKLECESVICKHHFETVGNNELFSCCICGKEHAFEEKFDLSYKKKILIPKLKKAILEMKQRIEFYETVSQDPVNFLNSQLLELKDKTMQRKNDLKQIVKNHYEQSLTNSPTKDLEEVSSLRNQCNKLNNFSDELEKFTQYLKTNQNFYIYHVYGQKLQLIGKILERKIQKLKDDIQTKILESLSIEKTNIPELLADAFGKISIKLNKENRLLTKDINGQVKIWDLEKQTCLYTINIRQCTQYYLNIFSQDKYLGLLFNEEKKTNILLNIYSYLINEARISLKNQTVSLSQVLKIKTLEKKIINCLLVVTQNSKIVIYDLRLNEHQMLSYDLFENDSLHKEASCLTYLNQDLNLLISCGFTDGNVALLSISKKKQYFEKLESSTEVPECFKFSIKSHLAPVIYLKLKKFSSNESLQELIFVSASSDGLVRKWIVKCHNHFDFELNKELSCEMFSACELLNENEIAIGLVNGLVRIMNFDGIQIMEMNAHSGKIKCIISNSYGELITGSEDKFIKVWNTKTDSCLSKFRSHFDTIQSIELIELNDFKNFIDEHKIEAKISQMSLEQTKQEENLDENHIVDKEII